MYYRTMVAVLLAAALAVAQQSEDSHKKDSDQLQGTWTVVDGEYVGAQFKNNNSVRVVFKGNQMLWMGEWAVYRLDSSKTPKQIDWTPVGEKEPTLFGLYAFENGKLKIAMSISEKRQRPVSLSTKPGDEVWILILERGVAIKPPAGGDEVSKKDKVSLQGKWRVVAAEDGGLQIADTVRHVIFKDETMGFMGMPFTFQLDAATKPKQIDCIGVDAKDPGWLGIYELEGDKLKICMALFMPRPTEFATKRGDERILLFLERVKDK